MKYIVSGTNRSGSRSLVVAQLVKSIYQELNESVEIIDLAQIHYDPSMAGHYSNKERLSPELQAAIHKVNTAEGLIFVVPEYNGSYPGALKYFIDFWSYPESFEYRPVCFIGLGGMFGGLRPVEHLQQVMGYRNTFQYPLRVFLINIFQTLVDGSIKDTMALSLLRQQAYGFQKFVKALKDEKIDANSHLQAIKHKV